LSQKQNVGNHARLTLAVTYANINPKIVGVLCRTYQRKN